MKYLDKFNLFQIRKEDVLQQYVKALKKRYQIIEISAHLLLFRYLIRVKNRIIKVKRLRIFKKRIHQRGFRFRHETIPLFQRNLIRSKLTLFAACEITQRISFNKFPPHEKLAHIQPRYYQQSLVTLKWFFEIARQMFFIQEFSDLTSDYFICVTRILRRFKAQCNVLDAKKHGLYTYWANLVKVLFNKAKMYGDKDMIG